MYAAASNFLLSKSSRRRKASGRNESARCGSNISGDAGVRSVASAACPLGQRGVIGRIPRDTHVPRDS